MTITINIVTVGITFIVTLIIAVLVGRLIVNKMGYVNYKLFEKQVYRLPIFELVMIPTIMYIIYKTFRYYKYNVYIGLICYVVLITLLIVDIGVLYGKVYSIDGKGTKRSMFARWFYKLKRGG